MENLLFSMDYSIMGLYGHFLGKLLYLGIPQDRIFRFYGGMWRSLVAHFVRDEGAAGSNPVIPICHLPDYLTALTNWCPSCQIIVRVDKLPSHQGVLASEAITIIAFIYWYCFSYGKSRTKCAFQPT